jgi:type II secretion system protein H
MGELGGTGGRRRRAGRLDDDHPEVRKPMLAALAHRKLGFTLIELILVMAILMIVVGLALPSLKGFFRGRNLDSEAIRFLALTRYGLSRAVSEGVPMELWINTRLGAYGLREEIGYTEGDRKAQEFKVDPDLRIAVAQGPRSTRGKGSLLPSIHFSPEGVISEPSVGGVCLQQGNTPPIWIVELANGLGYEIEKKNGVFRTPAR